MITPTPTAEARAISLNNRPPTRLLATIPKTNLTPSPIIRAAKRDFTKTI